jgi:hypothetical protein
MKRFIIILSAFFIFFPVLKLPAQQTGGNGPVIPQDAESEEVSDEEADEEAEEEIEEEPEESYISMDIRTSSLMELAAWCRELGISDGGSRDDLAARLRTYYGLPAPRASSAAEPRIITIESAKTTEYFTLEVVDEEYVRFIGDVIISLKDGDAVHRIKAWEILYNRTRNVMSATGSVEYVKEEGTTIETFKGESITVNLDNWSSIFMDGSSIKSVSGNTTAYRFAGTIISRNEEAATVLTGAVITNPANDEAHWSLLASKLWLLPGNDWAILNAILKVGNIPVLYLPFFFYPADEIVFHPVLGYRSREGTFLQTTTYILGRPKSTGMAENSLTRIFGGGSDNADKVREGVFLRSSSGVRAPAPGDTSLSVLFDAYVNLGAYLGTEVSLPAKGLFGSTTISAGLGLTRDIFYVGGNYTPFRNQNRESAWNSSQFFSMDVPLRYRLRASGSFRIDQGAFSWEIPFYSDPFVERDFMRRSEILDWLGMLREGATAAAAVDTSQLTSYEWRLTGSYNPRITSLTPYISSFSISSISSTLLFSERASRSYSGPSTPANPGRSFFFPNRFTVFSISASLAGNPFRLPAASTTPPPSDEPPPGDALLPDLPISPWEDEVTADTETFAVLPDTYTFTPPALGQRFSLATRQGLTFSVDYRLTPTAASEMQFRSNQTNWPEQKDINWGEISSFLSRLRSDANIGLNASYGGSVYTGTMRLSGTGSWQDYLYLNTAAEEFASASAITAARNRAYNETYVTSSWNLSNTVRPFTQSSVWGSTSFQHSVAGLFGKTTVNTAGPNPSWDWTTGKWDKTDITTHQLSTSITASIMNYNQSFSLSAMLPPRDSSVSANATFRAAISETSVRGSVQFPMDEELRKIDPVYFTETLRFNPTISFQQYMVYDPEQEQFTTATSSFSIPYFTTSFSALFAQPYRYNFNGSLDGGRPNGWIQMPDKAFIPNDLRFAYNRTFTQNSLWGNRLSFSVSLNSSLSFDLQRYTNSRFALSLGVRTTIKNFLDLNISTSSENAVIFKYIQGLPFFNLPTQLYPGQEMNFFIDLLNSFRFDNEDLRRRSGFKMKSLNLSLVHYLGDWNATLAMRMSPYLPPGSTSYRFSNDISFMIQWVRIKEIRTSVDYSQERLTIR